MRYRIIVEGSLIMNCDECKHYCWYYDHCAKWDCEVDAREVHNCFEERDTLILNVIVKGL